MKGDARSLKTIAHTDRLSNYSVTDNEKYYVMQGQALQVPTFFGLCLLVWGRNCY